MEGKDENKPKIVYFILAVFIHANVFLPFLSEKTGVHGAFISNGLLFLKKKED